MSAGEAAIAIRSSAQSAALTKLMDLTAIPPALVNRPSAAAPDAPPRRTKIWEFNSNLHCSIIGTCLSTTELRQVLKKLGVASHSATDHDLHGIAVSLAGRQSEAARQLNKALDHRHKLAISQFAKATTEATLRALWTDAVRRGDIPGAYWATLTHPSASRAVVREAFGDVHMLSHLVGSANRADLKRLCQLEAEKSELEAKLARQQAALHAAVTGRDKQIAELRRALAQAIAADASASQAGPADDMAALRGLVMDLERRLDVEARRRRAAEDRLTAARRAGEADRAARAAAETLSEVLRQELAAIEASLLPAAPDTPPAVDLNGAVLLYVGARPNQIAHLRAVAERSGATFLHHDGGVESHQSLLPGLVSRSDLVLFPVDCISHDAALAVKALCRQGGKRFLPLRSASIGTLLAVLRTLGTAGA